MPGLREQIVTLEGKVEAQRLTMNELASNVKKLAGGLLTAGFAIEELKERVKMLEEAL